VSSTWVAYLACYLVLAVCIEFAIVASLTLASTVQVIGRAAVMALTITVFQISRAIASQIGVPVLQASSLLITSLLAASLTLLGVLIALWRVQEMERPAAHDVT
jgi:predicted MFS family arabinose efflux permease